MCPLAPGTERVQRRVRYAIPRPATEMARDVIYCPSGHAWHEGALIERFSIRAPSLVEALKRPRSGQAEPIAEAWLIESETPYTYGDWVGDGIRALVKADPRIGPVLLPKFLAEKSYVRRDLERLGLTWISADRPFRIAQAHVLRKQVPSYYWGPDEVAAYRSRFAIKPVPPRPGSLVYLSRENIVSEAIPRSYPSRQVAQIVERLGGTVFDTRQASPEAFRDLATEVDTVIADQGSAIFGVLQWQTRRILEITTEHWWHNSNLFLSKGAGVEAYAVLVSDRYDALGFERQLLRLLDEIGYERRE